VLNVLESLRVQKENEILNLFQILVALTPTLIIQEVTYQQVYIEIIFNLFSVEMNTNPNQKIKIIICQLIVVSGSFFFGSKKINCSLIFSCFKQVISFVIVSICFNLCLGFSDDIDVNLTIKNANSETNLLSISPTFYTRLLRRYSCSKKYKHKI
jgi:hypothetical protein